LKVLLIGEFSSLHKYLKEGLNELGVETTLVANGDGWKKIGGIDYYLPDGRYGKNKIDKIKKYIIEPYKLIKQFHDYDVVQGICSHIFFEYINAALFNKLKNNNGKLSLCAAGDDYVTVSAYLENRLEHFMYEYDKSVLKRFNKKTFTGKIAIANDRKVLDMADVIIPCSYDYKKAYENIQKASEIIPFPINLKNINYEENKVGNKIVFFHGVNRELAKGTYFIKEALNRLKENYPNDVEVIVDGNMPFDQYIQVMKKTNVLIDQCLSYSYGMNACIGMAQGKVVLSGNRKEVSDYTGIKSPIINIEPDVDYIYNQLVSLLENKNRIGEIGQRSREFVEKNHNHIEVAKKYLEIWKSL